MRKSIDPRIDAAHAVDIHVGMRVRNRRKSLKVSQQELAGHLNLTFQQVQKYERGANRISASKLFEIAQVLHMPVAWFFEGYAALNTAATPTNDVQNFLSSSEAIDLGAAFLSIPTSKQRQGVIDLMKVMAGTVLETT